MSSGRGFTKYVAHLDECGFVSQFDDVKSVCVNINGKDTSVLIVNVTGLGATNKSKQ